MTKKFDSRGITTLLHVIYYVIGHISRADSGFEENLGLTIISYPFVWFTKLFGEQMVDSRVRQVFFGRIVLQFLQIDIPSRFELTAAGTREKKNAIRLHFYFINDNCQRRTTRIPHLPLNCPVLL